VIITVAGDGHGHLLYYPHGVAIDSSGNVYVVGLISNNAFKITPAGTISQIIDKTGFNGDQLKGPDSISAGPNDVIVSGCKSNNVFRICIINE